MKRCSDTFGELLLTGVLPNRDSEIGEATMTIAKTNRILKSSVNKLFPIENTCQNTNQTGTVREQKLRREAGVMGEVKRKHEC